MRFRMDSEIEASADDVFDWHASPDALTALIPPWEKVRVESCVGEPLAVGTLVTLRLPLGLRWIARHTAREEGRMFRDEQIKGPFRRWVHTHRFEPIGPDRSRLIDAVEYEMPFGWLLDRFVRRKLKRMFDYRHATTRDAFATL
jgi:ligand-binding SRPBCC domain-containing protein